ncbi:ankyrin repeat protein [Aspergillus terreus]|uniref:Ankyrin repeat protein n=1 Tax=Aspergillus terreus TaxID=33178 RepID=A0A5M3ZDL7_ASPTE|nr:hypothetical protein ATETN484_0012020600 [Aspergillus terreus]GFF19454.1 ankyrin repeat protein [Aspergillus terreus]
MAMKRLTAQQYTVGWISPLEVEQTAALLMVDEEHERLPQAPADPTVYYLGRIGHHNVVIAGLPNTGNTSAASVVTHMRRSFPNLRFGILVGIGGGVPVQTDEGDIRLGDLVVSKPSGSHSGAVQYDHGKAEVGRFMRTGFLTPPPAALLNAAQMLAAKRATCQTDPIKAHLKRIDTTRPQLRRYRYPGIEQDVLHSATCVPAQECDCGRRQEMAIQGTQTFDEFLERDQSKEETFIVIHRGTIASGEMDVKNGLLRDYLAQQHDVYCFETEAAGAMNDFPCLVIRGISAYCDAYKNNRWHGYAAAVAAAYARELFHHMPINFSTPAMLYINQSPGSILPASDPTGGPGIQEIAQWLSDFDFTLRHNEVCCRRQPGTGTWFLESMQFQGWLGPSQDLLFCSGLPGAGKTSLGSLVVDYLTEGMSSSHDVAIIYIYCDHKNQERQRSELLLGNLLKQALVQAQGPVPDFIESFYLKCMSGKLRPTIDEIIQQCSKVMNLFRQTFLIIDGLDEQDVLERRELLHYVFQIQQNVPLKIFATSRPIPEIREEFISRGSAEIEIQANDQDIAMYLQAKVHRLPRWVQKSPDLLEQTVVSITRASQGMFLLAYLLFESLLHKTTLKSFKGALGDLPGAIDAAYQQVEQRLQKQNSDHCSLARVALDWVTYTNKAITVSELRTAVSLDISGGILDEEDLPDIDTIVSVCCGLIEVNHMTQTVRYVHYTAKRFFEKSLDEAETHRKIAIICLTYLSMDVFASGACSDDDAFESRLQSYPLYHYASQEWGNHARHQSTELVECVLSFLFQQKKLESCSQALAASKLYIDDIGYSQRVPRSVTPAHLVSHFGLEKVAQRISGTFTDFSICDSELKTPLAWAAQSGHLSLIEYLLTQSPSSIHARDRTGSSPLLLAAQRGHDRVVHALVRHYPMASDLPDYFKRSPLWHAADKGHVPVVDVLLSSGSVDVNAKDIDGTTPLIRASANGYPSIVARLINSGADVNAREDRYGRTGFIWAALEGHAEVVRLFMSSDSVAWEMLDKDGRGVCYRELRSEET